MHKFKEIFKAYDVRGIYPEQINKEVIHRIGQACAAVLKPKTVAIGQDVRASGSELKKELIKSLLACGVDVIDIGTITTDQLYFAVGSYGLDGGISVTASHNPKEYNGLKFAEKGGGPVSSESLAAMCAWSASDDRISAAVKGRVEQKDLINDYVGHVLGYIDTKAIKRLKVVANANFGAVGRSVDIIADKLGIELTRLNWEEDGTFPKGTPNPLLPDNRHETEKLIKRSGSDLGVAWDADADRCFLFTGSGKFIPSAYIIALLAPEFLKYSPGAKVVHDVTTAWIIDDAIKSAGGIPVLNRTGHTFIKARMRQEDAPFAAESSGHYYFKGSFYADNGIVPLLKILEMISKSGKSLDELIRPMMDKYIVSEETNFTVGDPNAAIAKIEEKFGKLGTIDKTDGLSVNTPDWRFSVRPSNTEPLFRLNAEARDRQKLDNLISEVSSVINT